MANESTPEATGRSPARRRVGRWHVVAVLVVLVGLAVSTWTSATALRMGERPVTLLPLGDLLVASGLWALVGARLVVVAVVWVVAAAVSPRYRLHLLAGAGVWWAFWGLWQGWVLLALT